MRVCSHLLWHNLILSCKKYKQNCMLAHSKWSNESSCCWLVGAVYRNLQMSWSWPYRFCSVDSIVWKSPYYLLNPSSQRKILTVCVLFFPLWSKESNVQVWTDPEFRSKWRGGAKPPTEATSTLHTVHYFWFSLIDFLPKLCVLFTHWKPSKTYIWNHSWSDLILLQFHVNAPFHSDGVFAWT